MSNERGEAAFPRAKSFIERQYLREPSRFTNDITSDPGMSIRDYFAGQALVSLASRDMAGRVPAEIAKHCFDLADALLSARKEP